MIDLMVSGPTFDLTVNGSGDLALIENADQIGQAVQQALGTFFGEWFLDNTQGIPYFQQILVPNPNLDLVQGYLLNAIQNVPGVVQITSFQFSYAPGNRALGVVVAILTTNGQTIQVTSNTTPITQSNTGS